MARRSDHTKDELKELILSSTTEIVKKEGFQGLSARKIASKIGYTVGTIYNLYTNLDDLILQINSKTLDNLYEALLKDTANIRNPEQALKNLAKRYINFSLDNFNFWSMLYEHHFPRPKGEKLPNWYQEKIDRIFKLVEDSINPLVKNKNYAERLSKVLWAGLHGICTLSLTRKLDTAGAESAHILADSFIKVFIAGVKK